MDEIVKSFVSQKQKKDGADDGKYEFGKSILE